MRTAKTISKEMERLACGKYALYNLDTIGTLAWVLGLADSIPKGAMLAKEAVNKHNQSKGETSK